MNLFKLSPDTLYNLTCDVIDTLEYMIPESSFLSNNEVYAQKGRFWNHIFPRSHPKCI